MADDEIAVTAPMQAVEIPPRNNGADTSSRRSRPSANSASRRVRPGWPGEYIAAQHHQPGARTAGRRTSRDIQRPTSQSCSGHTRVAEEKHSTRAPLPASVSPIRWPWPTSWPSSA